jgi:hypothetical protein
MSLRKNGLGNVNICHAMSRFLAFSTQPKSFSFDKVAVDERMNFKAKLSKWRLALKKLMHKSGRNLDQPITIQITEQQL